MFSERPLCNGWTARPRHHKRGVALSPRESPHRRVQSLFRREQFVSSREIGLIQVAGVSHTVPPRDGRWALRPDLLSPRPPRRCDVHVAASTAHARLQDPVLPRVGITVRNGRFPVVPEADPDEPGAGSATDLVEDHLPTVTVKGILDALNVAIMATSTPASAFSNCETRVSPRRTSSRCFARSAPRARTSNPWWRRLRVGHVRAASVVGNWWVPGNCHVDSDWGPGGYCSPTPLSRCGGLRSLSASSRRSYLCALRDLKEIFRSDTGPWSGSLECSLPPAAVRRRAVDRCVSQAARGGA
jgi:hypothetical protein